MSFFIKDNLFFKQTAFEPRSFGHELNCQAAYSATSLVWPDQVQSLGLNEAISDVKTTLDGSTFPG